MIKLNRQVAALEDIILKLEHKIEDLEEKKQAVIDNACEHDRVLTAAEERRIDGLDEKIDELNAEADDVQNAIDYLREYTD